jgi:DNA repair protein RadC
VTITEWPEAERPREKLLSRGANALSDAELLAIFLRTGMKGRTALDIARDLLNRFNGLRGLMEATQQQVCSAPGVGTAKYAQLQASIALVERFLLDDLERGEMLVNPLKTRRYLKSKLRSYDKEVFACLFLDNQHRVIGFEELFQGTIDGASVYPREVVKRALENNAAAVIFAHNHPSGLAEPSQADIRITDKLKSALLLVDIRVLDHMIVGDGEVLSFAETGLL